MSVNPYLPEGVTELPAQRLILMALAENQVVVVDESEKQAEGISFVSTWESGSFSRDNSGASLIQVTFRYTAEAATTILVQATKDGVNWGSDYSAPIIGSTEEIRTGHAFFDGVTGIDLRFRFVFNTDVLVNIYSYVPRLTMRGAMEFFQ